MSFTNAIKFNIRYTLKALQLLKKEKFDVIHHVRPFELGSTFNLALLLGLHKNTPFVVGSFCSPYATGDPSEFNKGHTTVEQLVNHSLGRIIHAIISPLSYATLKKADAVFVVDKHTEELIHKRIPSANTIITPPGKDGGVYARNSSKGYEKGKLTFMSVGNFIPRKRFDRVIEAFAEAVHHYPDAKLLLVGSGFEEAKLRALVARLAIEKRVTFMGRVANKDMPALYAKADVYVAMPQEEAFGHVFIEAIASGMPVLSTNTVGAREIIGNKLFGRIVPQGNIKRMAHWMEYFLDHPEAVRASSMLARAEFEKKYDWEQVIIPRYVSVYERLISEKQALRAEPEPWRA